MEIALTMVGILVPVLLSTFKGHHKMSSLWPQSLVDQAEIGKMEHGLFSRSIFAQVLFRVQPMVYVGRSEFLRSVIALATVFPLSVSE